jgi:hypothetical protein
VVSTVWLAVVAVCLAVAVAARAQGIGIGIGLGDVKPSTVGASAPTGAPLIFDASGNMITDGSGNAIAPY